MGIGYIVLASCPGTSFYLRVRPVSLYTVIARVKSRLCKDRTKRDEHLLIMLQTVSNHESSGYPIDLQIFISKTYEKYCN